jgi:hypothetical protein
MDQLLLSEPVWLSEAVPEAAVQPQREEAAVVEVLVQPVREAEEPQEAQLPVEEPVLRLAPTRRC